MLTPATEIEALLEDSPSLKREVGATVAASDEAWIAQGDPRTREIW